MAHTISVDSKTIVIKSENEIELFEIIKYVNQRKKIKNLTKLHEYSQLEKNWDSEGAKPFAKKLINYAWEIIIKLDIQPEIFPTMRESIQLEYEKDNGDYLEFEIYEDRIEVFEIIAKNEREYNVYATNDLNGIVNEFQRRDG